MSVRNENRCEDLDEFLFLQRKPDIVHCLFVSTGFGKLRRVPIVSQIQVVFHFVSDAVSM